MMTYKIVRVHAEGAPRETAWAVMEDGEAVDYRGTKREAQAVLASIRPQAAEKKVEPQDMRPVKFPTRDEQRARAQYYLSHGSLLSFQEAMAQALEDLRWEDAQTAYGEWLDASNTSTQMDRSHPDYY